MKYFTYLVQGIVAIAVSWTAINSFKDVIEKSYCFHLTADEAFHAELIEDLAQTGHYQDWGGLAFAPSRTTGPTVIAPAALIEKLTKLPGAGSGRVVSLLYFLGALVLICLIFAEFFEQPFLSKTLLSLWALGLFYVQWRCLQDDLYYHFAILGEGAVLFYVLLAFYSWQKKRPIVTGLGVSLAILSKPYLLFFGLTFGFFALYKLFKKKEKIFALKLLLGLAIPWVLWAGWIAGVLGIDGAIHYWINYPKAISQASGNSEAALPFFPQVLSKINGFKDIFKFRGIIFFAGGILSLMLVFKNKKWFPFVLCCWIQFLWWFFLSRKVQARYLMPAFLICILVNMYWVSRILQKWPFFLNQMSPLRTGLVLGFVLSTVRLSLAGSFSENWQNYQACGFQRQLAIQEFWKNQKDRPPVYTTEMTYGHDTELVITAPHQMAAVDEDHIVERSKWGWIIVGENYTPKLMEKLKTGGCRPVFTPPKTEEGFWSCPNTHSER